MKKPLIAIACCVIGMTSASLSVHTETTSDVKTQYETKIKELQRKYDGLMTKYENTPSVAKVQKHNVKSQMEAVQDELKIVQEQLQAEEVRLKTEEAARLAEEARKAEEARTAEELKKINDAIANQQPVVGHVDIAYDNHTQWATYPWGQCTWGVKTMYPNVVGNYWGNANQWGNSARNAGYKVGNVPIPGAIISWTDSAYGHVAVVTDVAADGRIQVLEANYAGNAYAADPRGIGNYRGWFNPNRQGHHVYIYPNV